MPSSRIMALISIAVVACVAAMAANSPVSAEALKWWELGVTPSYGYGDDYPQRPREARAPHHRWVR
jgi:hypothetical protein